MDSVYINQIHSYENKTVKLKGWVSNKREGKNLVFIVMRDGTGFMQAVVDLENVGESAFEQARKLSLESSVILTGSVKKDERQLGGYELVVNEVEIVTYAEEYPIAKKEHGVDFLMDKRHLWLRSRKQWAIMRVRNRIIYAIHTFFQERGFIQMDAPILTGNACEGTTDLFETDYFGDPAYLSQSGQLYGEAMAMAQGLIYTFGPTFRAEKSKTRRHLTEFWMIEPEMAYYDNDKNMDLIEEFLKHLVNDVLKHCKAELDVLERDTTVFEKINQKFPRLSYDYAVKVLKGEEKIDGKTTIEVLEGDMEALKTQIAENTKDIEEREAAMAAGGMKKGAMNFNRNKVDKLKVENKELEEKLNNIPQWLESARKFEHGSDFGGSDETVLTRMFETPIMVYNWPAPIKAFYMKEVDGDPNYVKGVDVLAPEGFGEIVGGGERETDIEVIKKKIVEHELPMDAFEWYLDLRRYGAVEHAGFGLGLERTVCWICNIHHIREAVPFPRVMGRLLP